MKKPLLILLCLPMIGFGQTLSPSTTIGFVGNIPNAPLGMSLFMFQNDNIGFYFDCKIGFGDMPSGDDYSSTMSYNKFNDPYIGEYSSGYVIFDFGVAKPIIKSEKTILIGFIGLGYYTQTVYDQYFDPMYILSNNGYYYFETGIEAGINANLGIQIQTKSKINFQIGYDVKPSGMNFGVGYDM